MPQAQRFSILLLFVTAVVAFFVTAFLPPGMAVLAEATTPLSFGFAQFASVSIQHAGWFAFPATYTTAFGFLWAYGRLFTALASSGLLPKWLVMRITHQSRQNRGLSSRTAIGIGSLFSYIVCLIVHYSHENHQRLLRVCIGFAFLSYIAQTIGYLILHSNIASGSNRAESLANAFYRSPFGELDTHLEELVILVGVLLVLGIYYHSYAQHHQLISTDERNIAIAAATNASTKPSARTIGPPSQPPVKLAAAGPARTATSLHASDTKSRTRKETVLNTSNRN